MSAGLELRLRGTVLPDLALPATMGGAVRLSAIEGTAVVFLYPYSGRPGVSDPPRWDDIPGAHGSTPQAQGFAAQHSAYESASVAIIGLSGQSAEWQREFSGRLALPFPLLSDEPLALARALALPTFETGGVTYFERLTLVAHDGVMVHVAHPVADPAGHASELLSRLEMLGLIAR